MKSKTRKAESIYYFTYQSKQKMEIIGVSGHPNQKVFGSHLEGREIAPGAETDFFHSLGDPGRKMRIDKLD